MHFQVYCSIIHCSQDTDTTQMPTNEQIDKKDTVHVHNGILLSYEERIYSLIFDNTDSP